MSLKTRTLPVTEWRRLDATSAAPIWRSLNPEWAEVLVCERDGEIVASLVLFTAIHAECAENRGGPAAALSLVRGLKRRLRGTGAERLWTAAIDEPMRSILNKRGRKVPGEQFILGV